MFVANNRVDKGRCAFCMTAIAGVWVAYRAMAGEEVNLAGFLLWLLAVFLDPA